MQRSCWNLFLSSPDLAEIPFWAQEIHQHSNSDCCDQPVGPHAGIFCTVFKNLWRMITDLGLFLLYNFCCCIFGISAPWQSDHMVGPTSGQQTHLQPSPLLLPIIAWILKDFSEFSASTGQSSNQFSGSAVSWNSFVPSSSEPYPTIGWSWFFLLLVRNYINFITLRGLIPTASIHNWI